jgi:WD40 repeat protein
VILWEIPEFARHVPEGGNWAVTAAAASPTRNWVAAGVQEEHTREGEVVAQEGDIEADEIIVLNKILLRDGLTGELVGEPVLVSDTITHTITSLAFNPAEDILVSGSTGKYIRVWNIGQRISPYDVLEGHTDEVKSLAFSLDGRFLASGSCHQSGKAKKDEACTQGEIILWDTTNWRKIGEVESAHSDVVSSLVFSPDGKLLASGSCSGQDPTRFCDKGDILLWNVSDRGLVPTGDPLLGQNGRVEALAFSPDGAMLASGSCGGGDTTTGCLNGEIRFWEISDEGEWEPAGPPINAHPDAVVSLGFNAEGSMLASAGIDNSIIVWDLIARRPVGLPMIGHSDRIISLNFDPAVETLTSGSWDGTTKVWDVKKEIDAVSWPVMACLRAGRDLTEDEWEAYLPGEDYRETCTDILAP